MTLGNIEIAGIGAGLLSSFLFYFINLLKLSPERRFWISLASLIPFSIFFVFCMFWQLLRCGVFCTYCSDEQFHYISITFFCN